MRIHLERVIIERILHPSFIVSNILYSLKCISSIYEIGKQRATCTTLIDDK